MLGDTGGGHGGWKRVADCKGHNGRSMLLSINIHVVEVFYLI